jgi:3-oxoacyl-[acyl-carrier protein] reductase
MVAAFPDADILVNNSAGPPPKAFLDIDGADWPPAVERYMIAPLLLMQALLPGMIRRKFGRIININSASRRRRWQARPSRRPRRGPIR